MTFDEAAEHARRLPLNDPLRVRLQEAYQVFWFVLAPRSAARHRREFLRLYARRYLRTGRHNALALRVGSLGDADHGLRWIYQCYPDLYAIDKTPIKYLP